MNTEITTPKTFEQRMFERVRESIGDLMTEEDLKKIVDKAMHKAFFEERVDNSGYTSKVKPAIFVEMMRGEMQVLVIDAINDWLKNHQEEVQKILQDTLQAGIGKAIINAFEQRMATPLSNLTEQLRQKGFFS